MKLNKDTYGRIKLEQKTDHPGFTEVKLDTVLPSLSSIDVNYKLTDTTDGDRINRRKEKLEKIIGVFNKNSIEENLPTRATFREGFDNYYGFYTLDVNIDDISRRRIRHASSLLKKIENAMKDAIYL
jgi:hypothetical protein